MNRKQTLAWIERKRYNRFYISNRDYYNSYYDNQLRGL